MLSRWWAERVLRATHHLPVAAGQRGRPSSRRSPAARLLRQQRPREGACPSCPPAAHAHRTEASLADHPQAGRLTRGLGSPAAAAGPQRWAPPAAQGDHVLSSSRAASTAASRLGGRTCPTDQHCVARRSPSPWPAGGPGLTSIRSSGCPLCRMRVQPPMWQGGLAWHRFWTFLYLRGRDGVCLRLSPEYSRSPVQVTAVFCGHGSDVAGWAGLARLLHLLVPAQIEHLWSSRSHRERSRQPSGHACTLRCTRMTQYDTDAGLASSSARASASAPPSPGP